MKVHDFYEDLAFSHSAENWPGWKDLYKAAFPDMVSMTNHREAGFWQHAGIDRSLTLKTSKQILIDEKVRRKDYGKNDIALEYISNDSKNTPGWVCKDLLADYIAYLVAPAGVGYLLPVIQMQSAWVKFKDTWTNKYYTATAPNRGYNTLSCCVPVNVLFPAIGGQLRVSFEPFGN